MYSHSHRICASPSASHEAEFYIGCAGGIDTNTSYNYTPEPVPANAIAYQITVNGLKGGHSGVDIHLERGNANKIMNRLIYQCEQFGLQIASIDGGSLRNAIPRESFATVIVTDENFVVELESRVMVIKNEFSL